MRLSDFDGALADFRKAADLAPGLAGAAERALPCQYALTLANRWA